MGDSAKLDLAIYLVAIYVTWTVVNGMIARSKGRDAFACVLSSVIFSPAMIWLYLVAVPPKAPESDEEDRETSPGERS